MTRVLLRKELRAQAPFAGFVLALIVVDVLDGLLSMFPDQLSLTRVMESLTAAGNAGASLLSAILAFALGTGLLVREVEEGTLEHLDALPVSRAQIFTAKVLVASLILATVPVVDVALAAVRWTTARTSLFPPIEWSWLLTGGALRMLGLLFFASAAMALSFLGRFGWASMAVLVLAHSALAKQFPAVGAYNPAQLTRPVFSGQSWVIPSALVAATSAVTVANVAIAALAFSRVGDRLWVIGAAQKRWLSVAAVVFSVLAIGAASVTVFSRDRRTAPGTATFGNQGESRGETARYTMIYPASLSASATELLAVADIAHDAVLARLAVPPERAVRIVVDATGSARRTAGTASGRRVRLALTGGDADRAVLAHETAHVYAQELSGARLDDERRWTATFNEGLASYVEYADFRAPERLERLRAVAQTMKARHPLTLELAFDRAALQRDYDGELVYALGESFIAALVVSAGPDAPARVLTALGRSGVPGNLRGMERWRDAFQAAGIDLDVLEARWLAGLDEGAAVAERFPRLVGTVTEADGWVTLDVGRGAPPGYGVACRFRRADDARLEDYEEVCRIARSTIAGRPASYQLGYRELGTSNGVWEPWVELRIP